MAVVRYIHNNALAAGVATDIDRYRWSSHWGYLNKKQCPNWLNTRSVMSRFRDLKQYQGFMHGGVEQEIEEFYKGPYQKAVLGSKLFIERVREKLGDRARIEHDKPQSRQVFGEEIKEIIKATDQEYSTTEDDLKRCRRGGPERSAAGSDLFELVVGRAQA